MDEERLLTSEEVKSERLQIQVWTESKKIWSVAFPGIVARVTAFGTLIITQLWVGHIGEVQLAAYALVQTIFVQFVNGLLIGMSSATETLCGQAFGAGHYHMMGIYLQRSWIVDTAIATILLPLFLFTTPILKLIHQETEIANVAGEISNWFIPYIYYFVFGLTLQMYLQAQMKNQIVGLIFTIGFVIQLPLSWLFVSKLNLGIGGAMGSLNIASWLIVIGLFGYVFGGGCPQTWKGFSTLAFKDIIPVVKLSISSGLMICLEVWYYSIVVLLAGYMKNATVEISALSICMNINAWEFMIFLGLLSAACVRVANELGKGDSKAVKFSIKVILCTSVCIGVLFFILCLIFARKISYLFSSSEEIADSISDLSVLLAFSMLFNSIQPVLSGVAIGAGLQSIVAYINLGCYYGIGVPIGAVLGYVGGLQVKGLWIGMLSGVIIQTLILAYLIWRTDWDVQVMKASERLNCWYIDTSKTTGDDENSNGG